MPCIFAHSLAGTISLNIPYYPASKPRVNGFESKGVKWKPHTKFLGGGLDLSKADSIPTENREIFFTVLFHWGQEESHPVMAVIRVPPRLKQDSVG